MCALTLKYKGFNYPDYYNGEYSDNNSLPQLAATGANSVALTPEFGIDIANATVYAGGATSDTVTNLSNTIAAAKTDGLTSFVRPLVDYLYPQESTTYPGNYYVPDADSASDPSGYVASNLPAGVTAANVVMVPASAYSDTDTANYRGSLVPTDLDGGNPNGLAAFFGSATTVGSYDYVIVNEAKAAQAAGASLFSIGTELDSLANDTNATAYWNTLIADVRAVFTGKLTYSANWSSANQVTFWSKLDYVGIDGYVPLSNTIPNAANTNNPTLASLVAGWSTANSSVVVAGTGGDTVGDFTGGLSVIDYFDTLAQQSMGKQFLFTEIGYQNDTGAANDPTGGNPTGVADPTLQAELYQSFFNAWGAAQATANANGGMVDGVPFSLIGAYFWAWDPDSANWVTTSANYDNWQPTAQTLAVVDAAYSSGAPVVVAETGMASVAGYEGSPSAARGTAGITGTGALAGDTDPGGSALTITAVLGGTIGSFFNTTYGEINLSANGTYTYFPTSGATLSAAPTGAPAQDKIIFTVTDGLGNVSNSSLTISVYRDPLVVAEGATSRPSETISGSAGTGGTGALTGDSDPDGVTLSISGLQTPAEASMLQPVQPVSVPLAGQYGTLDLNADGSYFYSAESAAALATAFSNSSGPLTDSFNYFVVGGGSTYAPATLTITLYSLAAPAVLSVTTSTTTSGANKLVTTTLTMSEKVTVAGGTPRLTLNNGDTETYSAGSGTNTLSFTETVSTAHSTTGLSVAASALNGATIKDASGNAADLSGAVPSSPEVQGDIASLYQSILGHLPNSAGLTDWTEYLASGGTLAGIASGLATSAEAQGDLANLYLAILNRPIDSGGVAAWTQYLSVGGTLTGVAYGLATSTEAQGDLANLYKMILARPIDAVGVTDWTQYLSAGGSLSGVAYGLATTSEAQGDLASLYTAILGRPIDAVGVTDWTQYLSGGGSLAGVASGLATSAEAQGDLATLYQMILARPIDSGGVSDWTQYLSVGGSLSGVAYGLATSAEAQSDLANLYQMILARPIDSVGVTDWTQYLSGGGSLAGVAHSLATTSEAQSDLANLYEMILARPIDAVGVTNWTQYLSGGGSLAGVAYGLATTTEAQGDISYLYQAVIGRSADSAGVADWEQYLATGGSLAGMRVGLADSGEGQAKVTTLLQTDLGTAPTAAAVSAGQLQLADGLSLTDLNTQTLMLGANPQFLAGNGGTVAIPASGVNGVAINTGNTVVTGYNPMQDVVELATSAFPNLSAVATDESVSGGSVLITSAITPSISVLLQGVSGSSLIAADFRFH